MSQTTKEKGDLLENIIEKLCSGIKEAKVSKNAKILGKKSNTEREIDVLIEGQVYAFKVRVVVESKNYKDPVGIEKIESLKSKLEDVGADLGVMVCPTGFTEPAKKLAEFDGIQLFEIYDHVLGNCNLFIPLRYVEPEIKSFSFTIGHRAIGPFSMSQDSSQWRFQINGKSLNSEQLVLHALNNGMIPQEKGNHVANFGAVMFSDSGKTSPVQYCEVSINIIVIEKYYLKLFPASFLKNSNDGKQQFTLKIDAYSKEEDMFKNGWKGFATFEELNNAADIENQPEGIRNLIMRNHYLIDPGLDETKAE